MNIQWYPGHMAKTRRILEENLKLVDLVIEMLDARIPYSSQNPQLSELVGNKPVLTVLNKTDLADESISSQWFKWYSKKGKKIVLVDSKSGRGINELKSQALDMFSEKIERKKSRGMKNQTVRAMVAGIPNVGKSSLINRVAGRSSAKTADRPGVTRGKQWIRLGQDMDLLDTPGILWPKFENSETGIMLAFTGAIKDDVIDTIEVASELLKILMVFYPKLIHSRYKFDRIDQNPEGELLIEAAIKRGCLLSKGEPDLNRISSIILDEFRGGRIGRISLEKP